MEQDYIDWVDWEKIGQEEYKTKISTFQNK